jgi:pyruvate kinase
VVTPPGKVVEAMHRICLGAESHFDRVGVSAQLNVRFERIDQAIAMAAMLMAKNVSVQAIVALTESGSTAQWLSRVQSSVPIFALSPNVASRRRMALFRDVYPVAHHTQGDDLNQIVQDLLILLWHKGHIKSNDRVIVTMGDTMGNQGGTNTLRLIQLGPDGYAKSQSGLNAF